jgi:hypothetical protein
MEVDFTIHSRHCCIRDGAGSACLNGWCSSSRGIECQRQQ